MRMLRRKLLDMKLIDDWIDAAVYVGQQVDHQLEVQQNYKLIILNTICDSSDIWFMFSVRWLDISNKSLTHSINFAKCNGIQLIIGSHIINVYSVICTVLYINSETTICD